MKHGTMDIPKFKRLKRALGESDRGTVGLLECIWQRATKQCPRGDIGRFSNADIAIMGDYEGDAEALVAALVDCGWFDESTSHRLVIHDWHEHAPNWLRGVVKRHHGGFVTNSEPPTDAYHGNSTMASLPSQTQTPDPNHKSSPPPNPSAPDLEPLSPAWVVVVVALEKCDVRKAEHACLTARARGVMPHNVQAVIDFWLERRPAWPAGSLYYKVLNLRPDEKLSARWPMPSVEVKKIEEQKKSDEKVVEQVKKRRQSKAEREKNRADFSGVSLAEEMNRLVTSEKPAKQAAIISEEPK